MVSSQSAPEIAEFQPPWLRAYVRAKLRLDPVYEAVHERLKVSSNPLLDIGCGLGLLSLYLRRAGYTNPIVGVDFDEKKVFEAQRIALRWRVRTEFFVRDAREGIDFLGDVVLLDLLHYFSDADQQILLANAAGCVAPGGKLIVRECIRDGSWRYRLTYLEELFATSIRWLKAEMLNFPTLSSIVVPMQELGFDAETIPLSGALPFNNHLLTFTRSAGNVLERESPASSLPPPFSSQLVPDSQM